MEQEVYLIITASKMISIKLSLHRVSMMDIRNDSDFIETKVQEV